MNWAFHAWPSLHCTAVETALALIESRGGVVLRAVDTRDGIFCEFIDNEGRTYRMSVVRLPGESNASTGATQP